MLKKRVITALWGIPLLVAVIWFGEPWNPTLFTVFIAVWALLAAFEFYRLVTTSKVSPLTYFGLVCVLLFIVGRNPDVLSALEPHFDIALITPLILSAAAVLSFIWLLARRQKEGAFAGWAWTMAGVLYIGWLRLGLDDGWSPIHRLASELSGIA